VLHFGEALACELRGSGVTATTLCPGPTRTAFHDNAGYAPPRFAEAAMMPSAAVARAAYDAMMAGKPVVIPGASNQLLAVASQLAPRRLVTRIMERLLVSRAP